MKTIQFFILIFLSAVIINNASAEEKTESEMNIRIDLGAGMPSVNLFDTGNSAYQLSIVPENTFSLGLQFTYQGFSLGLSTDSVFGGDAVVRNLFIGWFGERAGFEVYHQNFSDFFITEDSSDAKKFPEQQNEYPDINIYNTGISFYYFFRDNNYRGLYSQNETILKNSWSPFAKVSAGRFSIHNPSPILPAADRPGFSAEVQNINRYGSNQASLSAGITGTVTYNRFYFSPLVSIGIGGEYCEYGEPGGAVRKSKNIFPDFDLQAVIGYIRGDFFWGCWFINENQFGKAKDLSIQMMNLQGSYFAGMRF